jgi:hypothetical protein
MSEEKTVYNTVTDVDQEVVNIGNCYEFSIKIK